jgi:hypothetical protein
MSALQDLASRVDALSLALRSSLGMIDPSRIPRGLAAGQAIGLARLYGGMAQPSRSTSPPRGRGAAGLAPPVSRAGSSSPVQGPTSRHVAWVGLVPSSSAQPAVVKVISSVSGVARARALIHYLGTRESEPGSTDKAEPAARVDILIRTERGERIETAEEREALLQAWAPAFDRASTSRDLGRFRVKLPEDGVDKAPLANALRTALGDRPFLIVTKDTDETIRDATLLVLLTAKGKWLSPSPPAIARVSRAFVTALGTDAGSTGLRLVSTAHGVAGVRRAFQLLENNERSVVLRETGDGVSAEDLKPLGRDWVHTMAPRASRDLFHVVFSARAGSDPVRFTRAVERALDREFADHRFAYTLHQDRSHVHVHAVIVSRSILGQKLNPRKADLHRYRETLAEAAREQGIAMAATRRDRASPRAFTMAQAKLVERGEAHEATRIRVAAGRQTAPAAMPLATDRTLDTFMETLMALKSQEQIRAAVQDMERIFARMDKLIPEAKRQGFEAARDQVLAFGAARLAQVTRQAGLSEEAVRATIRDAQSPVSSGGTRITRDEQVQIETTPEEARRIDRSEERTRNDPLRRPPEQAAEPLQSRTARDLALQRLAQEQQEERQADQARGANGRGEDKERDR